MKNLKLSLWYLPAALLLILLAQTIFVAPRPVQVSYSELQRLADQNHVERAMITTDEIRFQLRPDTPIDGELQKQVEKARGMMGSLSPDQRPTFVATRPPGLDLSTLVKILTEHGVTFSGEIADNFWRTLLLGWLLPFGLIMLMWNLVARRMGPGGAAGALSFGRNKAKIYGENDVAARFTDVAGIDEAKAELEAVVSFLRDPAKYQRLGGRIPKGVLLVGPPGTGKTLLARAIAGEAHVPFFSISGSEFIEMFVGLGAARVRDLFEQAKGKAPCIVFIDELDAVGKSRAGAGLQMGRHDEQEQTLNQLLVEMDGFESNDGVILIAATNRPDVLDPALLRPGRFDRRVIVPRPDVKGREGIIRVHLRKVPLGDDVDVALLARSTPGFSGADLENLVNEAALLAARNNKEKVSQKDFELAKDKVLMGSERRSMIISDEEKRNTAYHEAGHALVAKLVPGADPVHKVTIIPRGMALGLTQQVPTEDRYSASRTRLENDLAIFFGGRAAEEIVLGQVTTGAGNDIERATDLARKMVCEWGMSEKLGPMTFGSKEENIFLGRDFNQASGYSESTAQEIDAEIRSFVSRGYERARKLLTDNIEALHKIALALLDREVLDSNEIDELMRSCQGNGDSSLAPAAS